MNAHNLTRKKIEKVARDLISKPLIYDENLFIVKNGSITQYD